MDSMRVLNFVLTDYVKVHLIDGMIDLRLMIAVMPYSMEPPTIMVFAPPRRTQVIMDWMMEVAGSEEVIIRA